MGDFKEASLAVDAHKNVFVVIEDDNPHQIGTLRYDEDRFWFIPIPKMVDGQMGLMGFDVEMLKCVIQVIEKVSETLSDEEMDALFNGNTYESGS